MNILDEVKTRLSITGSDLDGTIQGMIDDVISYCRSAGLKYTQLVSTRAVGLIARGVADLWNYGAGNGKFSDIFQLRLNQMTLDAASLDHDVELQEKSVTITENGTTEIVPDDGYVLSSVNVDVNVPSKPEQSKAVTIRENGVTEVTPDAGHVLTGVTVDTAVPGKPEQTKAVTIRENGVTEVTPDAGHVLTGVTVDTAVPGKPEQVKEITITENGIHIITPDSGYTMREVIADVSVSAAGGDYNIAAPIFYPNVNGGFVKSISDIKMDNVNTADFNNWIGMFKNLGGLTSINWGGFFDRVSTQKEVISNNMFNECSSIEIIDMSSCPETNTNNVSYMFYLCSKLKQINWGGLKIKAFSISYMFQGCEALETLDLSNMISEVVSSATRTFNGCTSLTNIIFPENLFPHTDLKNLDLLDSPLSHDCAVDIFNKLATRTNSPMLKLSSTTKGYLTESEIAIATGKGWVVS